MVETMNIEQKARAYDEAFERARKIHKYSSDLAEIKRMENIFPELKESKDEEVRKELLSHCIKAANKETIIVSTDDYYRWSKWLEKQGEQKSAWSEDYTEKMGQIINYLTCQAKEEPTRRRTLLGWVALLKSIFRKGLPEIQMPCTEAARKGIHCIMDVLEWAADKGRISDSDCEDYMILLSAYLPRPKIAWSEEDEEMLDNVIFSINHESVMEGLKSRGISYSINSSAKLMKNLIDWLKSLRPHWKPSDEQMKALHDMNLTGNISYTGQEQTLIELYNDLKKL